MTPEIQQRIVQAIAAKVPEGIPPCPLCKNPTWTLANGYVMHILQQNFGGNYSLAGPSMPCAALTCTVCGNTLFLNLIGLGLTDLFPAQVQQEEVRKSNG